MCQRVRSLAGVMSQFSYGVWAMFCSLSTTGALSEMFSTRLQWDFAHAQIFKFKSNCPPSLFAVLSILIVNFLLISNDPLFFTIVCIIILTQWKICEATQARLRPCWHIKKQTNTTILFRVVVWCVSKNFGFICFLVFREKTNLFILNKKKKKSFWRKGKGCVCVMVCVCECMWVCVCVSFSSSRSFRSSYSIQFFCNYLTIFNKKTVLYRWVKVY